MPTPVTNRVLTHNRVPLDTARCGSYGMAMSTSDQASPLHYLLSLLESRAELERLCGRIEAAAQGMRYAGCPVHVHSLKLHEVPPGKRSIVPHVHSYYEALFIVCGQQRETCGLRNALGPGSMQLHAPGQRHGWTAAADMLVRFGVSFTLDPPVALRPLKKWPAGPEMFEELAALFQEARRTGAGAEERIHARLVLLLARFFALLDWPEPESLKPSPSERPLVEAVDRFLLDNLAQPLTLEDVALVMHVSVPTLNRRYRELSGGNTVINRFNTFRLAEAARLLRETRLPVGEIATRIGFSRPSYFCRCFRGQFGCSPNQHRRAMSTQRSPVR